MTIHSWHKAYNCTVALSAKSKSQTLQIALRLFSLFVSFLSFPMALHYSGSRNFGLFIIITSSMAILTISDFGIGLGLQSALILAGRKRDKPQVARLLSDAIVTSLTASICVVIIISTAIFLFDWKSVFHLESEEINIFKLSALLGCLGLFLTVNGIIYQKILISYNRFTLIAVLNAAQTILSSGLLVISASTKQPLVAMVLAQLLVPGIFNLLGLFLVLTRYDLLKLLILRQSFKLGTIWSTFLRGRLFLVLQVTTLLSFQIDNLLIGRYFSPESVAVFGLAWKIASVPVIVGSIYLASFWSEILDIVFKPQFTGAIRISLLKYTRDVAILAVVYGFVFITLQDEIGRKILGDAQGWDSTLILLAIVFAIFSCLLQPVTIVLNSLHCEKFLVKLALVSTISNVALSFYLTKYQNLLFGPFVGSIMTMALVLIPCYVYWIRSKIETDVSNFKTKVAHEN